MALACGTGVKFTLQGGTSGSQELFGEDQARYLVAMSRDALDDLGARATEADIGYFAFANFEGEGLSGITSDGHKVDLPLSTLRDAHEGWLPTYMNTVD